MSYATDTLARIQAAITARLTNDAPEDITLPDGTSLRSTPLETLFKLEQTYTERVARESGSSSRPVLATLRPFR